MNFLQRMKARFSRDPAPSPYVAFTSGGGGGGQHKSATRAITPEGQRILDWTKTLPPEQQAAVAKAYTEHGFQVNDFMSSEDFNHWQAGNYPSRFNPKTGVFVTASSGTEVSTVITTDPAILVSRQ